MEPPPPLPRSAAPSGDVSRMKEAEAQALHEGEETKRKKNFIDSKGTVKIVDLPCVGDISGPNNAGAYGVKYGIGY